jgi:hypothetical protein
LLGTVVAWLSGLGRSMFISIGTGVWSGRECGRLMEEVEDSQEDASSARIGVDGSVVMVGVVEVLVDGPGGGWWGATVPLLIAGVGRLVYKHSCFVVGAMLLAWRRLDGWITGCVGKLLDLFAEFV